MLWGRFHVFAIVVRRHDCVLEMRGEILGIYWILTAWFLVLMNKNESIDCMYCYGSTI